MIIRHNVPTYARRDYSDNGTPLIVSRSEGSDMIHKFNDLYRAGKITAGERAAFTEATVARVVPL
jgi:hypothetical protein